MIGTVAIKKLASTYVLRIMFLSVCAKILILLCLINSFHITLPSIIFYFSIVIVDTRITIDKSAKHTFKLNSHTRDGIISLTEIFRVII
jgi:hypothetical protein